MNSKIYDAYQTLKANVGQAVEVKTFSSRLVGNLTSVVSDLVTIHGARIEAFLEYSSPRGNRPASYLIGMQKVGGGGGKKIVAYKLLEPVRFLEQTINLASKERANRPQLLAIVSSPTHRAKVKEALRSEAVRTKMSQKAIARSNSREGRAAMSAKAKMLNSNPIARAKMAGAVKAAKRTPEARARASVAAKAYALITARAKASAKLKTYRAKRKLADALG